MGRDAGEHKLRNAMTQLAVTYRGSSIVYNDEGAERRDPATLGSGHNKESETAAQPGDRAPETPGLVDVRNPPATLSLFDIFAPSVHSGLVFAGNGGSDALHPLSSVIARQPEGTVRPDCQSRIGITRAAARVNGLFEHMLVDRDGHAHAGYNVSGEKVVVQSDGFIGARVHSTTGIDRYFGRIFASGFR